jgi:hypothetical protein
VDRNSYRSAGLNSHRAGLDAHFFAIGQLFDRRRKELLDYARKLLRQRPYPMSNTPKMTSSKAAFALFSRTCLRARSIVPRTTTALCGFCGGSSPTR